MKIVYSIACFCVMVGAALSQTTPMAPLPLDPLAPLPPLGPLPPLAPLDPYAAAQPSYQPSYAAPAPIQPTPRRQQMNPLLMYAMMRRDMSPWMMMMMPGMFGGQQGGQNPMMNPLLAMAAFDFGFF